MDSETLEFAGIEFLTDLSLVEPDTEEVFFLLLLTETNIHMIIVGYICTDSDGDLCAVPFGSEFAMPEILAGYCPMPDDVYDGTQERELPKPRKSMSELVEEYSGRIVR